MRREPEAAEQRGERGAIRHQPRGHALGGAPAVIDEEVVAFGAQVLRVVEPRAAGEDRRSQQQVGQRVARDRWDGLALRIQRERGESQEAA